MERVVFQAGLADLDTDNSLGVNSSDLSTGKSGITSGVDLGGDVNVHEESVKYGVVGQPVAPAVSPKPSGEGVSGGVIGQVDPEIDRDKLGDPDEGLAGDSSYPEVKTNPENVRQDESAAVVGGLTDVISQNLGNPDPASKDGEEQMIKDPVDTLADTGAKSGDDLEPTPEKVDEVQSGPGESSLTNRPSVPTVSNTTVHSRDTTLSSRSHPPAPVTPTRQPGSQSRNPNGQTPASSRRSSSTPLSSGRETGSNQDRSNIKPDVQTTRSGEIDMVAHLTQVRKLLSAYIANDIMDRLKNDNLWDINSEVEGYIMGRMRSFYRNPNLPAISINDLFPSGVRSEMVNFVINSVMGYWNNKNRDETSKKLAEKSRDLEISGFRETVVRSRLSESFSEY